MSKEAKPVQPEVNPGPPNGEGGNHLPAVQNNVEQQPGPPTVDSQPGPPTVDSQPGPPNVGVQPGPPTVDSQPGPPNMPGPPEIPLETLEFKQSVQRDQIGTPRAPGPFREVSGLKNEADVIEFPDAPPDPSKMENPRKPRGRGLLFGIFILLLCLLLGMAAILSGALNQGGTAGQPTQEVTSPPVSTEDTATSTVPEVTQPVGGVCGSACGADTECASELVCSPNTQGASTCLRNGHCGCGVPCDPSAAAACDPGLSCTINNGVSTCWAGGCEPTAVPGCVPLPGDGVCSACEDATSAPQDCAPVDTGGGNNGGGGSCGCKCKTVCTGMLCTRVCKDCKGKVCTP